MIDPGINSVNVRALCRSSDSCCMRNLMFVMRIAVLCATAPLIAQEEVKWGKIPESDLAMTTYPLDPEAGAVILCDVGKVEFELRTDDNNTVRKERHVRIKFLTQVGIEEYGDIQIWYYSHDNKEIVTDLIAQVYLPDGTHVNVKEEHIFKTAENNRWTSLTIAVPSLVPGAIVEYQYRLISQSLFEPVDWFFQREIPVAYSDLTVTLPHYYSYVILQKGRQIDQRLA